MSFGKFIEGIEESISQTERRPFDTYLLAPLLIWYGLASKKAMGKWPRRLLVTAGIYQLFYNWREYRKLQAALKDPGEFARLIIGKQEQEREIVG